MKEKVDSVMDRELLEDLENRTKRAGPFEHNFDDDKATSQALMDWLCGVGDDDKVAVDAWTRLRLLLNYTHDRGMRLGAERVAGAAIGFAISSTFREITHWGSRLTGQDVGALIDMWKDLNWKEVTLVDILDALTEGEQ